MRNKAKFLFRLILSLSILTFAIAQIIYAIKTQDMLILVVGCVISLVFAQYSLLNLTYLLSENSLKFVNGKVIFRVGNLEATVEPQKIGTYKIKRVDFILLKEAEVRLLKYPFLATFLIKPPFLFQFSFFGCHSYPPFFRNEKELEKFREINSTIFGEEIVLSAELLNVKELSSVLQDRTL